MYKLFTNIPQYGENKESAHEKLLEHFGRLEKYFGDHKFAVGDYVTWVDFLMLHYVTLLGAWSSKIKGLENISKFVENMKSTLGEKLISCFQRILKCFPNSL